MNHGTKESTGISVPQETVGIKTQAFFSEILLSLTMWRFLFQRWSIFELMYLNL